MQKIRERIICNDGTSISIQASEFHYCMPRNNVGPYSHVEVGYPSVKPYFMMKYAEDPKSPTDTVYGGVPVGIVLEFLNSHCGIKSGELPPFKGE